MRSKTVVIIIVILSGMLLATACSQLVPSKDVLASTNDDSPSATSLPEIDEETAGGDPTSVSAFFAEELQRAGVERVGQPIEGFNAMIYLEAFPGFEAIDFDGVETLEGIYTVEDGKIAFLRTTNDQITSAEETISEAGYKTLLANFSERVGIEVKVQEDIALLLDKLREGDVYPDSYIFEDFSIWLPENWYVYDLGHSVLFVHDPDLDLSSQATEGFAFAPYIQVVVQEIDLDTLLDQNLWTYDSEFLVSKNTVRIGNDERLRVVTYAGGADGQVLNYLFDAGDGRVLTVSTYPYQPGSPDTDDFERAIQGFMINYVLDGSQSGE